MLTSMNVAILHFHLRRGGVTTVMRRQASCLAAHAHSISVAFISGSKPEMELPAPVFVVPGLDYDSITGAVQSDPGSGAADLARAIDDGLRRAFPEGCDLIHVHNPLLNKNARLLGALRILQDKGHALLIQEHDFAEDFRPEVYDARWPYPENCTYATINSRDRNNLVAAGLKPAQVWLLPNPVSDPRDTSPDRTLPQNSATIRRTALYPVRAIKRKNIGEALLLSRFLPEKTELVVTLPPTSASDYPQYTAWKTFASEGGFPLRFDAGLNSPLSKLYEGAFTALSTSVKEGFGYSFLEPLVHGLKVVGRGIPHIMEDFKERGILLDDLYRGIMLPSDAVDKELLRASVTSALSQFRSAFGSSFIGAHKDRFEAILSRLGGRFEEEELDFGSLDHMLQEKILHRIDKDSGFRARILERNPVLSTIFRHTTCDESAVEAARKAALEHYSERAYAPLLAAAYESALSNSASGSVDKAILLERFLAPADFYLVAV